MKIQFRQVSKKEIKIIGIVGKKRHEIGRIFTPSGSGHHNEGCVQVCGFSEAFDLWGCGCYAIPETTKKTTRIKNKTMAAIFGTDTLVEKHTNYQQVKDIQLLFNPEVKPVPLNVVMHGADNCLACFNDPCTCEVKVKSKNQNPYTVKREQQVIIKKEKLKPTKAK